MGTNSFLDRSSEIASMIIAVKGGRGGGGAVTFSKGRHWPDQNSDLKLMIKTLINACT